ncbi:MAG: symmetrical bis(5'-nucleosyl)-tetraphosphatase [Gammaproteobacteria bacterium]|nr:symmetrical bis(5'-nucleosyl)-tetraphosphatase [Gammaproteobacteria bacterium]
MKAVYVIGDVQGCYSALQALLEKIEFKPTKDRLWFAGDLVNRGPDSLAVLRFVKSLSSAAITVLGNHDLHLLAMQAGVKSIKKGCSLAPIFKADDGEELLCWLRQQPLLHYDKKLNYVMTHAGIYPRWDLAQAQAAALEVEAVLRGDDHQRYFEHMYGDQPDLWSEELQGAARWRFITNSFTRMRFCSSSGQLDMLEKHAPGQQADGLVPWFDLPSRVTAQGTHILFGHWAALSHSLPLKIKKIHPTDTGCVWGGELTALKLQQGKKPQRISVLCEKFLKPA